MNAKKKGGDAGRSDLAKSKLFGALLHVHNPFSMNVRKGRVEGYTREENNGNLGATDLQVEMSRAEASLIAYNLIACIQKS